MAFTTQIILGATLAVLLLSVQGSVRWGCETLAPIGGNNSIFNNVTVFKISYRQESNRTWMVQLTANNRLVPFEQFIIQARPANNIWDGGIIGTFTPLDWTVNTLPCKRNNDTAYYANLEGTRNYTEILWTAPNTSGSVVFL